MTDYLFLDTQVFDRLSLNFTHHHLGALTSLVSRRIVHIVLPDVIRREIQGHIGDKVQKILDAQHNLSRLLPTGIDASLIDADGTSHTQETLTETFLTALESFLTANRVLTLDHRAVHVDQLLDQYFDGAPPFGVGKKKTEFPDAIAGMTLHEFAKSNRATVHVVTDDGDWKSYCSEHPDVFEHHESIERYLKQFPDHVKSRDIIDRFVANHWPEICAEIDSYLSDTIRHTEHGGEVHSIRMTDLEISDSFATYLDDDRAELVFNCRMTVEIEVEEYPYGDGVSDFGISLGYTIPDLCVIDVTLESTGGFTVADFASSFEEPLEIRDEEFWDDFKDRWP